MRVLVYGKQKDGWLEKKMSRLTPWMGGARFPMLEKKAAGWLVIPPSPRRLRESLLPSEFVNDEGVQPAAFPPIFDVVMEPSLGGPVVTFFLARSCPPPEVRSSVLIKGLGL